MSTMYLWKFAKALPRKTIFESWCLAPGLMLLLLNKGRLLQVCGLSLWSLSP